MADEFAVNLLRMIASELHYLNCAHAAHDLFSKPYYSLSAAEKGIVDRTVLEGIGGNYTALTPEFLVQQQQNPVGFVPPAQEGKI